MTDETINELRQDVGVFGICFHVAWARAARDARHRHSLEHSAGTKRNRTARGAVAADMIADGENVFERVLI